MILILLLILLILLYFVPRSFIATFYKSLCTNKITVAVVRKKKQVLTTRRMAPENGDTFFFAALLLLLFPFQKEHHSPYFLSLSLLSEAVRVKNIPRILFITWNYGPFHLIQVLTFKRKKKIKRKWGNRNLKQNNSWRFFHISQPLISRHLITSSHLFVVVRRRNRDLVGTTGLQIFLVSRKNLSQETSVDVWMWYVYLYGVFYYSRSSKSF